MPPEPRREEPPAGGGKKILGMKRSVAIPVIAGALALGGTLIYMWWKSRTSASSSATTSTSASSSAMAQDYAGQLSVIQTELEEVLAQRASASTGTSTSSGGGGTTATSSKTTTSTPAKTTSKTTTTAAKALKPGTPGGIHATKVTATSVTLAWNKSRDTTSYRVRVTYQGKLVKQATASGTSVTVSGLSPDHTYTFHVAASGPGGTSAESNGPAVKTSK